MDQESKLLDILLKPQVPPNGTHVWEVIASVNTYPMCINWFLVFEIFNERQILNLKPWLYVSFNLKTQVERIVDVWSWTESDYVLPKSAMWNSWTNEFAKQGMHGEFFKYFSMKLMIQLCLKIFISSFSECIDQPVLRNEKNMHAYVLSTCNNRNLVRSLTTLGDSRCLKLPRLSLFFCTCNFHFSSIVINS